MTIDGNERINVHEGMQNMFFLSKDTIATLIKLADDNDVEIDNHIIFNDLVNKRFEKSMELAFLEKNIFRFNNEKYKDKTEDIIIYEGSNPKEEINYVIGNIISLTREQGYRYRDIAIVAGDVATYGKIAGNMLEQNEIPCFIDNKRSITGNPFVELICGALEIIVSGYSYESMFRYLKTGLIDIDKKDIDKVENYCLAMGIRGGRRWKEQWNRNFRGSQRVELDEVNGIREQIITPIAEFEDKMKAAETVFEYVSALYEFVAGLNIQSKLEHMAAVFEEQEDKSRRGEYSQVYKKVIDLFDKLVELLGNEKMAIKEFNGILEAGFEEIKVGLIPPSVDSVVVGDIERTRLDNVKVLFFVGVNDGIVPKKYESSGVLSETDRDSLEKKGIKLSPSAREKAFTQRFYLYLNMTKPSEKLYLSYSQNGMDGKSVLQSYLIRSIRKMYPNVTMVNSEIEHRKLEYVQIPKAELLWEDEKLLRDISRAAAFAVYGKELYGSVTRIEEYASCQLAHFLDYGLALKEREKYSLEVRDIGTILHTVLESISVTLKKEGRQFNTISEEYRRELVNSTVIQVAEEYGNTILKDSKRNEYMISRLIKLADRTIWALGKQLDSGKFIPDDFEVPFLQETEELEGGARASIQGKIDRIDICEDEDNLYVKVIDYKSGKSDFELLKTYYGLKLQLLSYMKAAVSIEKKKHPDKNVIPAGVLYYNISDPIVDRANEAQEDTELRILEQLKNKGLVNGSENIAELFDDTKDKSIIVPVSYNKTGELKESKNIITTDKFNILDSFADKKYFELADSIMKGKVQANPYKMGNSDSCTYCAYKAVCGFSENLPDMKFRSLKKFSDEELWEKIRKGDSTDEERVDQ